VSPAWLKPLTAGRGKTWKRWNIYFSFFVFLWVARFTLLWIRIILEIRFRIKIKKIDSGTKKFYPERFLRKISIFLFSKFTQNVSFLNFLYVLDKIW
jgi:hypothetical protein